MKKTLEELKSQGEQDDQAIIDAHLANQVTLLATAEHLIGTMKQAVLINYRFGEVEEVLPVYNFIHLSESEFGFVSDDRDVDINLSELKAFKHSKKKNTFTFEYEHRMSVIYNVDKLDKKIRKTIKKYAKAAVNK